MKIPITSRKDFRDDTEKFYATFNECGNPFKESEVGLLNVVNKFIVDSKENESVSNAYVRGKTQYDEFVNDRLHTRNKSIYLPLKSNKFLLFRQNNSVKTSKVKKKDEGNKIRLHFVFFIIHRKSV